MKLWGNQVHAMTISFFLALLLADMPSPPTDAATVRAVWLADLDPARVAELAVSGPLLAAGRLQSFSLLAPSPGATLSVSGAEV